MFILIIMMEFSEVFKSSDDRSVAFILFNHWKDKFFRGIAMCYCEYTQSNWTLQGENLP